MDRHESLHGYYIIYQLHTKRFNFDDTGKGRTYTVGNSWRNDACELPGLIFALLISCSRSILFCLRK